MRSWTQPNLQQIPPRDAPSDPAREEHQVARLRRLTLDADLDPAFAEKWFNFVVAEVIHHHEQAANGR